MTEDGGFRRHRFHNPEAEKLRIRYLYRVEVLRGRMRLPVQALRSLVGPDCAYHLYRLPGQAGRGSKGRI
jgi:hypothetical protein